MVLLHQTIKVHVGDRGVSHPRMPVLDRQLAGDDGGLAGRLVVDDLQQVGSGLNIQRRHAPVV